MVWSNNILSYLIISCVSTSTSDSEVSRWKHTRLDWTWLNWHTLPLLFLHFSHLTLVLSSTCLASPPSYPIRIHPYLDVCQYICLSVYQSVNLLVCISVNLSVCQSVCLSVCFSVSPSVNLSVCVCVCASISLCIYQSALVNLSVCVCLSVSVCLCVCLRVRILLTS
jgi:hypothetical protein